VDTDRHAEDGGPDPDPNPNEPMWRAILDGTDPIYRANSGPPEAPPGDAALQDVRRAIRWPGRHADAVAGSSAVAEEP